MNPRLPAIIVFALCAATPLWAASHVWTGANSNLFSDSGNWAGGSPAGDTGADLYFPTGPAVRALSNDIAPLLTVRTITFSGTGYTINGSRINVTSSITDDTAGPNELVCDLLLS